MRRAFIALRILFWEAAMPCAQCLQAGKNYTQSEPPVTQVADSKAPDVVFGLPLPFPENSREHAVDGFLATYARPVDLAHDNYVGR